MRDRQQVAGQRDQPEGREDGGQREQQRNARGHERAEGEHEDDQRDRDREQTGLPEVVAVRRLDRLDRARVAELADEEARMGTLRVGDAVEDGVDLVDRLGRVAADLELDERRVPVLRDLAGVARGRAASGRSERPRSFETRATTSAIAALKAGSLARSERLWIRTLSPAGCLKPASRIRSTRPDSPGPAVFGSMLFVPTMPPMRRRR